MFKIYDGRESFYQWDIDRKLIVDDPTITQVHFCNRTEDCSLVCETYVEDGLTVVNVPNALLQTAWRIRAYAYDSFYTKFEKWFEVNARTKPTDYVYTETETVNYNTLLEKMTHIEENIGEAVADYLEENPLEVDLSSYYTMSETDDKFALKTDIPSLDGLATEAYVNKKIGEIPEVDLSGYAKKTDIPDVSGFATEDYVAAAIKDIELTPGPKGDKGDPGDTPVKGVDYFDGEKGDPGEPGKTPIKGTDYWTEADKSAMVADVIAALPVYEGEVL